MFCIRKVLNHNTVLAVTGEMLKVDLNRFIEQIKCDEMLGEE